MLVQHANSMGTQQGRECKRRLFTLDGMPITFPSVLVFRHPACWGTSILSLCHVETCLSFPCSPQRFVTIATFFHAERAQINAGLRFPSHFCTAGRQEEGLASRPGTADGTTGMLWLQDSGHRNAMRELVQESLNIMQTLKL